MGNSRMRPETVDCSGKPSPSYETSIYMIRDAVRGHDGLIAGKLHANGQSCAVGAFWDDNPGLALSWKVIDEVALYNDSVKTGSPAQRRRKVLAWLNWKLRVLTGHRSQPKPKP